MKTQPLRILTTVLFALAGLVGRSRKVVNPRSSLLASAQAEAMAAKIVLTELREGRLTNALELLEQQIDCSIIAIGSSLSKVSEPEREIVVGGPPCRTEPDAPPP
jgi:hypothetical protein